MVCKVCMVCSKLRPCAIISGFSVGQQVSFSWPVGFLQVFQMDFGMHALEFPMMVAAHALILWPKTDPPWYPLAPHILSNFFVWFFPFSLQFFSESTRVCFNDLQTLRCSSALQIPAASKTPKIFFRRLFVTHESWALTTFRFLLFQPPIGGRLNKRCRLNKHLFQTLF